ncbi:hypothetical protein O181_036803 [Austropuccinia psidii MF-1]|uniref:Uncharacterized protein n=1 Tax=Austropuccinia psidii MF-1 TaxID=1389203 RepID=A0A9Q3D849_9BASI|nr:hypothetical protein [Austropuccinia psidii MF-1]
MTKIGRTRKKLDIKSANKPFIKKYKPREHFKQNINNNNEQRKCHKCGGIGNLANNWLKKANINGIVGKQDHNDKENGSNSEKDSEYSETSGSYEINRINSQINDIDLIYDVLDVNSNLKQLETYDTSLKDIQDSKIHRTKPGRGI